MKQSITFIIFWLLFPIILCANHVHWLGDYDTAFQKAHKEHKPLLVLVVKKESSRSNKIIKDQFMNHAYVDAINQKMVPVIVMYEGRVNYPIEMYYTRVFPTLFFVDTKTETFMGEPLYGEEIKSDMLENMTAHMDQ